MKKIRKNFKIIHLFFLLPGIFLSCKKGNQNIQKVPPQSTPLTPIVFDTSFETGGSNYATYSVGNYLDYPTDSDWFDPYNLRPVIGTYHLAPATVKQQLATMFANGQRKIALDLWYSDLFIIRKTLVVGKLIPNPKANQDCYGHPDGKPADINKRRSLILYKISPCDFKIAFNHILIFLIRR
jgi:hypothetical protein